MGSLVRRLICSGATRGDAAIETDLAGAVALHLHAAAAAAHRTREALELGQINLGGGGLLLGG